MTQPKWEPPHEGDPHIIPSGKTGAGKEQSGEPMATDLLATVASLNADLISLLVANGFTAKPTETGGGCTAIEITHPEVEGRHVLVNLFGDADLDLMATEGTDLSAYSTTDDQIATGYTTHPDPVWRAREVLGFARVHLRVAR